MLIFRDFKKIESQSREHMVAVKKTPEVSIAILAFARFLTLTFYRRAIWL